MQATSRRSATIDRTVPPTRVQFLRFLAFQLASNPVFKAMPLADQLRTIRVAADMLQGGLSMGTTFRQLGLLA